MFPAAEVLPRTNQMFNHYVVADSGFPLTHSIIRPYIPPRNGHLSERLCYFNYRLGRSRIVIENTFGILVARWRIFHRSIAARPKTIDKLVKATIVLHNFIKSRKHDNIRYVPPGYVDAEQNGEIISGEWRNEVPSDVIEPIQFNMASRGYAYKRAVRRNRDILMNYVSPPTFRDIVGYE